ncbi:MAG: GIY-YIG nuclease family protein [Clostridiales bacterium]|nr:GIY-YIG nuclease family protein [Clostridiales bacterium]
MNYVYILQCNDGSLYTGWTTDLDRRIEEHNSGKGSKYTRGRLPVKLVHYEVFDNKSEAMKREYKIKKLSHLDKVKLIRHQII